MTRRGTDEDNLGMAHRAPPFNGIPGLLRLASGPGLAIVLVFWLLGAFPWMPSPVGTLVASLAAVESALAAHELTSRRLLHSNVLICRGMWQGNDEMQRQCGNGAAAP